MKSKILLIVALFASTCANLSAFTEKEFKKECKRLGINQKQIPIELIRPFLPILKDDFFLCKKYPNAMLKLITRMQQTGRSDLISKASALIQTAHKPSTRIHWDKISNIISELEQIPADQIDDVVREIAPPLSKSRKAAYYMVNFLRVTALIPKDQCQKFLEQTIRLFPDAGTPLCVTNPNAILSLAQTIQLERPSDLEPIISKTLSLVRSAHNMGAIYSVFEAVAKTPTDIFDTATPIIKNMDEMAAAGVLTILSRVGNPSHVKVYVGHTQFFIKKLRDDYGLPAIDNPHRVVRLLETITRLPCEEVDQTLVTVYASITPKSRNWSDVDTILRSTTLHMP